MPSETSAIPIQPCKHCGTDAPVDVHFCPRCDKIMTLGRHGDYFRFFGLQRRLQIDSRDLEQRFRALSRQFHPDFYQGSTSPERLASLERSSYLNDAFRTLRDPIARLEYVLKLEGFSPKESRDASNQVPARLLEEVFDWNEQIDEIQALRAAGAAPADLAARIDAARRPLDARLAEHERQLQGLMARHDAQFDDGDAEGRHSTLDALRTLVLERTYLTHLLAAVARESAGGAEGASS
jgi:molecular chaperone HscB